LIGADDSSLIGIPLEVVFGSPEDLRHADAGAVGKDGFGKVWLGEEISLGKTIVVPALLPL